MDFVSIAVSIALIFFCTLTSCKRSHPVTELKPGVRVPDFSLPSIDGITVNLLDYRGKVVLLNFWATWCAPCVEEMPALGALYEKYKDQGLVVVAIAEDDDIETVSDFVKKLKLPFPILHDTDGAVRKLYKIRAYPETVIVNREGELQLFSDPRTSLPEMKIIGPRNWEGPELSAAFQALLSK